MKTFIHLRIQSDYSFGCSNIKIKDLVKKCYQNKMPAICLADNNMFGTLEFALESVKNGIQPIMGAVVSIDIQVQGKVLLIAKNHQGYQNLIQLVSIVMADRPDNPFVIMEDIIKYHEGLILIAGGPDTIFATDKGRETIHILKKYFEIFVEIMRRQGTKYDEDKLLHFAYQHHLPIVGTSPIAFLNPEQHEAADVLSCIINNESIATLDRFKIDTNDYFKDTQAMYELFEDLPEAIQNTVLIAKKCSYFPTSNPTIIPSFPDTNHPDEYLRTEAIRGLSERLANKNDTEKIPYYERLNLELDLIFKMQFSNYFLIVSDFIKWSKSQGIAVGPGRGSGVGSVIAWSLYITEIDPLEFSLLFERFLNPERISLPDFDIDFCQLRRDEVINYILQKYGYDKVAHIITFGKLQPRAVLRDVGRVMQMPYGLIDKICKMVPQNQANPVTLQQAINIDQQMQDMAANDQQIDKLLKIGLELEGCHRHVSTHAAGVIIADKPIVEVMPLYKDPESLIAAGQFSMKYVEAVGLIKFDFLGLKTLTVIAETKDFIEKSYDISFDIYDIPRDDKATYDMLVQGETLGVFQLEGAGMREAMKQLKPDCLSDIIALTSLYRPGPMENIPIYAKRKHGQEKVEVLHPKLENVLKETYGIIVYQEQVMEIAKILAGYSLGQADILRRAMGKKDKVEMATQKDVFINSAVQNGIKKQHAEEIFDFVAKFASYGFNKSHATAYSLISYQTAYLKCHYPIEFIISSINLEMHIPEVISNFIAEAKKLHISCLPPDINQSMFYFSIETDKGKIFLDQNDRRVRADEIGQIKSIRYGLGAIRNVGEKTIKEIIIEREKNGLFKNFWDFIDRCYTKFNKRSLEYLIKSNAFVNIHNNSKQLLISLETVLNYIKKKKIPSQLSLFEMQSNNPLLSETKIWDRLEQADHEYKSLGFYLTTHPVALYLDLLLENNIKFSNDIQPSEETIEAVFIGVVKACKIRSSKGEKSHKYAFLTLEDPYGIIDISVFRQELLQTKIHLFKQGTLVICNTIIKQDRQGQRILLQNISSLLDILGKNRFQICINDPEFVHTLSPYINRSYDTITAQIYTVENDHKVFFEPVKISIDTINLIVSSNQATITKV